MGAPLAPIQVIPPGLVGLLQLKQLGRLPDELLGTVQPVVEMRDWYMQARQDGTLGLFNSIPTLTVATSGTGAHIFSVPSGQFTIPRSFIWYVEQMTCIVSTASATDTCRFAPIVLDPTQQEIYQLGPDFLDSITTRNRTMIAKSDRSFWAVPGSFFGIWVVDALAGTTLSAQLFMRATRLPI